MVQSGAKRCREGGTEPDVAILAIVLCRPIDDPIDCNLPCGREAHRLKRRRRQRVLPQIEELDRACRPQAQEQSTSSVADQERDGLPPHYEL